MAAPRRRRCRRRPRRGRRGHGRATRAQAPILPTQPHPTPPQHHPRSDPAHPKVQHSQAPHPPGSEPIHVPHCQETYPTAKSRGLFRIILPRPRRRWLPPRAGDAPPQARRPARRARAPRRALRLRTRSCSPDVSRHYITGIGVTIIEPPRRRKQRDTLAHGRAQGLVHRRAARLGQAQHVVEHRQVTFAKPVRGFLNLQDSQRSA